MHGILCCIAVDQLLIIDRIALAKEGDNTLGSVRLSVCPLVCLRALSRLTSLRCLSVCL